MLKRPIRSFFLLALGWFLLNLSLVGASWSRSFLTPINPMPQVHSLDLRADKSVQGRVVSLIGTKPTPSKGDYIGHMWVAWPQTPPGAPAGTKASGFYADSQMEAVGAMATALLLPWGFVTGQAPVGGHMKVDDGWWRHVQIDVTVDEARYQAALAVDTKWRTVRRYSLRPGIAALGGQARTWTCQDYVRDVAIALGLKATRRDWTQFPMGSFLDFAKENGVVVRSGGPI
jgi:hypothetical protein